MKFCVYKIQHICNKELSSVHSLLIFRVKVDISKMKQNDFNGTNPLNTHAITCNVQLIWKQHFPYMPVRYFLIAFIIFIATWLSGVEYYMWNDTRTRHFGHMPTESLHISLTDLRDIPLFCRIMWHRLINADCTDTQTDLKQQCPHMPEDPFSRNVSHI